MSWRYTLALTDTVTMLLDTLSTRMRLSDATEVGQSRGFESQRANETKHMFSEYEVDIVEQCCWRALSENKRMLAVHRIVRNVFLELELT